MKELVDLQKKIIKLEKIVKTLEKKLATLESKTGADTAALRAEANIVLEKASALVNPYSPNTITM